MNVYLFRHGIAVDIGEQDVKRDADRMLSIEGREKTNEIGKALKVIGCAPTRLISSPLVRAEETADILTKHLGCSYEVEEFLSPGMKPEEAVRWLQRKTIDSVMLVGHEPDFGSLASYLISGEDNLQITFKKAGACCISFDDDIDAGFGALEWIMQPKQSRCIAKR